MNLALIVPWLLSTILGSSGVVRAFALNQSSICNCVQSTRLSKRCNASCPRIRVRGGDVNSSMAAAIANGNAGIPSTPNTAKYHLIWSPNFWKKLLISFGFWSTIGWIQSKSNAQLGSMLFNSSHAASCHSPMRLILPLLSSSCCAIQLIINAISGLGCAGFNTYLGET